MGRTFASLYFFESKISAMTIIDANNTKTVATKTEIESKNLIVASNVTFITLNSITILTN